MTTYIIKQWDIQEERGWHSNTMLNFLEAVSTIQEEKKRLKQVESINRRGVGYFKPPRKKIREFKDPFDLELFLMVYFDKRAVPIINNESLYHYMHGIYKMWVYKEMNKLVPKTKSTIVDGELMYF